MNWIRHVVIDLAITVIIILATIAAQPWAAWIVYIYTPLMVLLKLGSLKMPQVKQPDVPDEIYHFIYGLNVGLSAYYAWSGHQEWWWVAAGWACIWAMSAYAVSRR